ncbi:hypothetical protein QVM80_29970, partial [Enterobacter hormaechei]|uniref:hypothetical protein n=1 Tax=Enterobacter hormaechei TaxID=158836 RepID=UPI003523B7CD
MATPSTGDDQRMTSLGMTLDQDLEAEHRAQRLGAQDFLGRTEQVRATILQQQQAVAIARGQVE